MYVWYKHIKVSDYVSQLTPNTKDFIYILSDWKFSCIGGRTKREEEANSILHTTKLERQMLQSRSRCTSRLISVGISQYMSFLQQPSIKLCIRSDYWLQMALHHASCAACTYNTGTKVHTHSVLVGFLS